MQIKSFLMGIMLVAGLMGGCGGVEGDTGAEAAPASAEGAEVSAQACSDCAWLFRRCMTRASTNEAAAQCAASRAECEETFCGFNAGQ